MVKEGAELEITEFVLLVLAMQTSINVFAVMALTVGIGFCVNVSVDVKAISMIMLVFIGLLCPSTSCRTRRSLSLGDHAIMAMSGNALNCCTAVGNDDTMHSQINALNICVKNDHRKWVNSNPNQLLEYVKSFFTE